MTRESAQDKACRIVSEGRVTVTHVNGEAITARVRGDAAEHLVTHDRHTGWRCTCPTTARTRCSHKLAVGLVTVVQRRLTVVQPPKGIA